MRMSSALFLLLIPLVALTAPDVSAPVPLRFVNEPVVVRNPNARAPLAALLSFSTNRPVSTQVKLRTGTMSAR